MNLSDTITRDDQGGAIGVDGYLTLLLSNLVLLLSGGLYWCWLLGRVFRVAKNTGTAPVRCDAISVLGMRLDHNAVRSEYVQRLKRAKCLFDAGAAQKILVIGGLTGDSTISEAQGGKDYLVQLGIAADCILLEDRSRHTLENLSNVRALYLESNRLMTNNLQKSVPDENDSDTAKPEAGAAMLNIVIVTNRFHLARSQIMAETFCISHTLSAAEDRFVMDASNLLRLLVEAYFIHWYMVGKVWSRVTRNRKSLGRIS